MLYRFPEGTRGIVREAYARPYDAPIRVRSGDYMVYLPGKVTDMLGWAWCRGPDGKSGWVPEAWIDSSATPWRMLRDLDAWELTVAPVDALTLHFSESGFLWATTEKGEAGWVPDACVSLAP